MLTSLIPLADDNQGRRSTPFITYSLIAANIAVFVFCQLPSANDAFTYAYAAIPYEIVHNVDLVGRQAVGMKEYILMQPGPHPLQLTIFSAMFMHGGWMHLLGNMLYLWIFGDNVEDELGHFKHLVFYLVCGFAAALAHILSGPNSVVPSLGASGAIAGVLGGYLIMFPTKRIRVIGWIGLPFSMELPAFIVVGLWLVMQFISSVGSIAHTDQSHGGVAYWAHVGGALAGLFLVNVFRGKKRF